MSIQSVEPLEAYLRIRNNCLSGLRKTLNQDTAYEIQLSTYELKKYVLRFFKDASLFADHLSILPRGELQNYFEMIANIASRCSNFLLYSTVVESEEQIGRMLQRMLESKFFAALGLSICSDIYLKRADYSWYKAFMERQRILFLVNQICDSVNGDFWDQSTVSLAKALSPNLSASLEPASQPVILSLGAFIAR